MKNAMKKVMSILLVALLLVSALPLAASAQSIVSQATKQDPFAVKETKPVASLNPVQPTPTPTETQTPAATQAPAAPAAAQNSKLRTAAAVTYDEIKVTYKDGDEASTTYGETIAGPFTETGFASTTAAELMAKHLVADAAKYTVLRIYRQNDSGTSWDELSASAVINEGETIQINLKAKKTVTATIVYDTNLTSPAVCYGDSATVTQLIQAGVGSGYEFASGTIKDGDTLKKTLVAGETILATETGTIEIVVTKKAAPTTTPPTTTPPSSSDSTNATEYYNKFPYNVYLNIYKDTMVGAPDKTLNITKGAALDGTVTMDEVKALVMNHYSAKNSYGISFDGLYLAEGTWVTNYVTDTEKFDKFVDVDVYRQVRTVYINVMIDNAYAKNSNSGTADPSNPKTGDAIYAPIAVLGVSATALAAVMFFYNKKRLAQ